MVSQAAELELRLIARDEMSKAFDHAKKSSDGLSNSISSISKIAAGFVIGEGLTKLPGLLTGMVKSAVDDEASAKRLQQAIGNAGGTWDQYHDKIEGVIKTGQRLAFSDDQTRDSLSLLVAQTDDVDEAMRRYAIAQDLARGANIDVVTASRLLGKVTDENVNVLARYGIKVEKGAKETELFAAIQAKFGGQAKNYADSAAGKFAQLTDRISEAQEAIGYALLPLVIQLGDVIATDVLPVIEDLAEQVGPTLTQATATFNEQLVPLVNEYLPQLVAQFNNVVAAIAPFAQTFLDTLDVDKMTAIGAVIGGVVALAFGALAVSAGAAAIGVIATAAPFIAIGAAAGILGLAIYKLIENWDELATEYPILQQALDAAGEAFDFVKGRVEAFTQYWDEQLRPALENVRIAFEAAVTYIYNLFSDYWPQIQEIATKAFDGIKANVQLFIDFFGGIGKIIVDLINGDFGKAWNDAKEMVSNVWWDIQKSIESYVLAILNFLSTLGQLILDALGDLYALLKPIGLAAFEGLWDGMKEKWESVKEWLTDVPGKIVGGFKDALGIGSPSKVFQALGISVMEGLKQGIFMGGVDVVQYMVDMTGEMRSTVEDFVNYLAGEAAAPEWLSAWNDLGRNGTDALKGAVETGMAEAQDIVNKGLYNVGNALKNYKVTNPGRGTSGGSGGSSSGGTHGSSYSSPPSAKQTMTGASLVTFDKNWDPSKWKTVFLNGQWQNVPNVTVYVSGSVLSERDLVGVVRDAVIAGGLRGVV